VHEYDTVLKALLQSPRNIIFERITGDRIDRWLNVEFPEVQQTRVDLLGETADKRRIIGVELQSTNDAKLPLRMAEYALRTFRLYGRFPEQYVLYVGNAKLRMKSNLDGPAFIAITKSSTSACSMKKICSRVRLTPITFWRFWLATATSAKQSGGFWIESVD
jgi:hypothetical protein